MGYHKNKMLEKTYYCYICQEEIRPDEKTYDLDLYTEVDGTRKQHVAHPCHFECLHERDFNPRTDIDRGDQHEI